MSSDLSPGLVLDMTELNRLQQRIKQLQVEKSQQRDLYCEARNHHVRLLLDRKDMDVNIQSKTHTGQHLGLEERQLPSGLT